MTSEMVNGPGHNSIRCEIVTNMNQLMQVFAVRAIAFMDDTGLPYDHAFDGNDLQATHVVIYDTKDEPVAALRIRWFDGFAKIERSAFRKEYRDMRSLKAAAQFVFRHIAQKGYSKVITHASREYALLWRRALGFKEVPGKEPAYFHGEPHFELVKELEGAPGAISLDAEIRVLFRTEGKWDRPEKYEEAR